MIVSVAFFWVPSTASELGLEKASETVSFSLTRSATHELLSAVLEFVFATAHAVAFACHQPPPFGLSESDAATIELDQTEGVGHP